MNESSKNGYSYLNREGRWLDFERDGLELREDGSLQLYSVPILLEPLPETLSEIGTPDGPAGIAVDVDGSIYWSDPSGHRIFRLDACDQTEAQLPCLGGHGQRPGRLNTPRGLLIPHHRRSLFVADSANHRIQVFDLNSFQLVDIWGQNTEGAPSRSSDPGRFDTPWTLAADRAGNIYVVDYGNRRVQKFNYAGDVVPAFWKAMKQSGLLKRPSDIAVYASDSEAWIYVIDEAAAAIYVFDSDGRALLDEGGHAISIGKGLLQKPMGIAVSADSIYVGDNGLRRVLKFARGGTYPHVGEAIGYSGPVAALVLNGEDLLVHSGASMQPLRLSARGGYRTRGVLFSKAIKVRDFEVSWHRASAEIGTPPPGAHLRLFVFTSNDPGETPVVDLTAESPFADTRWRPQSGQPDPFSDAADVFIGGGPAVYLWIGALFTGDGKGSAMLSQMRVEFDHETYLKNLPAIYRGDDHCANFLLRFVSLFETFNVEVEDRIKGLAALFDPDAAPARLLPWLATWLALDLSEEWDEQEQRRAIADAFAMYARRGTAAGLRDALRSYAGVHAVVEEPLLTAAWWALPAEASGSGAGCGCAGGCGCGSGCGCGGKGGRSDENSWEGAENSVLGVTTMLGAAHPQGAVLGSTATLDQSHLISQEEFGAPLFDDVAHRFTVQIHRGELACAERLALVRDVIEREKPAHTDYHLCVIEPRLRVGFQARVGIDAVVGGPPPVMPLGEALQLGETTLGGEPGGIVGERSRVGLTTRVG